MHSLIAASVLLNLVGASPLLFFRQAVTDVISPSAPAPSGCLASYASVFGIAVQNITTDDGGVSKRGWGGQGWGGEGGPGGLGGPGGREDPDWEGKPPCNNTVAPIIATTKRCTCEDPVAPTSTPPPRPPITVARVSQIGDGQIQGSLHTITMWPINEIGDGQIQNQRVTYAPDNYTPSSTATSAAASDGTDSSAATNTVDAAAISDTDTPAMSTATAAAAPTASDTSSTDDPDNTETTETGSAPSSTATADSSSPSSASEGYDMVACRTNSSLQLHLSDSILTDSLGRTGYIASNYQFQFDNPPQSEALYTAGWGVCSNGSLSLGGSTTFWQCLSGEFYNLYDRNWAAQCSPIEITVVRLEDCGDTEG